MRAASLAFGLVLGLVLMSPPASAGPADVQVAAIASSAVVAKCRKAVFRKYGRRSPDATGKNRLYLNKNFVVRQVDVCVANGGRVG